MGCATTLQTLIKGLPLAYHKDLQETQEPLFDASDTVIGMLPLVTGFMNTVEFNEAKMNQAASSGFMNAWAAAVYLVERGVPSRLAHEAVGKALLWRWNADAICKNCRSPICKRSTRALMRGFHSCLGLTEVLALHDVPGGTAPRHVKRALLNARSELLLCGLWNSHEPLAYYVYPAATPCTQAAPLPEPSSARSASN